MLALGVGITARAAEPPRPRNGTQLVIVNDDGFSAFHSGRYRTAQDLRQAMLAFRETQVAVVEWCVIAGSRANYPSHTTELIGTGMNEFPRRGDQLAHATLRRMADAGEHTLKIVAAACHESGIACYASLRMNGDYAATMWGDGSFARYANSTFWWQHPEFRIVDAKGKPGWRQSFAYPEVRAFRLGILREVARQDIDGINLDFLRHPTFFGHERPMAEAFKARYGVDAGTVAQDDPRWVPLRYDLMTSFVREVRLILDEAGQRRNRRLGLSVRVDWQKYATWGCDFETWMKEGLLDYVVIAQYGLGGYEFDLAPFVRMARGTGCAVLFGEEATVKGHDRTAEEDRLIAAGKMIPPASTLLTREQYVRRAGLVRAVGGQGLHLFNEGRKEMMSDLDGALSSPASTAPKFPSAPVRN